MLYRIHTEDKNREDVERIVGARFSGFTILTGTGYWQSTSEPTLVIEIVAPEDRGPEVYDAAEEILRHNEQQAVLVVTVPVTSRMIVA